MTARNKRRREELKDMGRVIATAFHEPKKLDEMLKPSIQETVRTSTKNPDSWDGDEWWKSTA